jgi:hypothetical protein
MSGLLQSKPEAVRRRENVSSDVRRRSETRLTVENGMSTLVKRIMRAPSRERMRKTVTSLVVRMEDLEGIGPIEKSPHVGNLGVKEGRVKGLTERGVKKKGLTDQGDTEKNPIMRGLGGATRRRR